MEERKKKAILALTNVFALHIFAIVRFLPAQLGWGIATMLHFNLAFPTLGRLTAPGKHRRVPRRVPRFVDARSAQL